VCGEGYYCPAGSGSPVAPNPGQQLAGGGTTTRTHVTSCDAGYTCSGGMPSACPAGRYGSDGLSCVDCGSPEVFCPGATGSPERVREGHFSVGGLGNTTRTGEEECVAGTYCSSGLVYDCGSSSVWCGDGASNPSAAQPGMYTTPSSVNDTRRTGVSQCEPGEVLGHVRQCCSLGNPVVVVDIALVWQVTIALLVYATHVLLGGMATHLDWLRLMSVPSVQLDTIARRVASVARHMCAARATTVPPAVVVPSYPCSVSNWLVVAR